ncbi:lexA repressor [bacterium BMS3Bbin03]|nr:lexA repressor [bacterium BMS3Bbin03]HDZ11842.1 transcriptional repressor LexA [Bacteroidota bacterium]
MVQHGLTPRQQEIFDFIRAQIEEQGLPPTYREIGDRFQIRSTNGVYSILEALRRKGYLEREPSISRGLKLKHPGKQKASSRLKPIPLVGRVAAGAPILAEENIEAVIGVDEAFFGGEGYFALRVQGDSMINAGIFNSDVVIARQQATAQKGDIVVAIIGDEATVKYYFPEGDHVRLQPANDSYRPILVRPDQEDFRIAGKVAGLIRKM